jgi:hypothetical protein
MKKVNQAFRKKGLPKILLTKMIGEPKWKRMGTFLTRRRPPILRVLTERYNKCRAIKIGASSATN